MIIPAADADATLGRTLAALAEQRFHGDYEVIVVDDGSRDRTTAVAEAGGAHQVLRQLPSGPAAARNLGVAHARHAALAFCDADVYPTPGWLAAGVAALERHDIVQGMVLPDPGVGVGPFDRSLWIARDVGLFETANLFVSRELFDRVGGFEQWLVPRFGKHLAEDVWFGYRALRAGARAGFCTEALAHHAVFPRAWPGYVAERARVRYFPAMARQVPELRGRFLYRRLFLTERSARFDLALAGAVAALRTGAPEWWLEALPYLKELRRHSKRSWPVGPRASLVAVADVAADAVGTAALAAGSLRYRSPVI